MAEKLPGMKSCHPMSVCPTTITKRKTRRCTWQGIRMRTQMAGGSNDEFGSGFGEGTVVIEEGIDFGSIY